MSWCDDMNSIYAYTNFATGAAAKSQQDECYFMWHCIAKEHRLKWCFARQKCVHRVLEAAPATQILMNRLFVPMPSATEPLT
eukprot:m.184060 g.184060  ORF g.184060 m.184060 type:complete len:82 (+) comp18488_c0_seq16:2711-2956(+)